VRAARGRKQRIPGNTLLATASCTHYRTLPSRFWAQLADGSIDLADRSFA